MVDATREFRRQVVAMIRRALEEDIGKGDLTTDAIVDPGARYQGEFWVKAPGVIAGLQVAKWTFQQLDSSIEFHPLVPEGTDVSSNQVVARVWGKGRALLTGERVALNFVQRMSGIATLTRRFVDAIAGSGAIILDTRKTAPGLRLLDKWAVRLGGGQNHRMGLFDRVLIKDNHIQAAGGIPQAVQRIRRVYGERFPIEVEVTNLTELKTALDVGVEQILLDNMDVALLKRAVKMTAGRAKLEASGNVSLHNVAEVARTGVDYISVGQLTHSVQALDVSFLLRPIG